MTAERGASAGTWVGFSAMTLGMFMAVLDIQIVVTSLPEISEALTCSGDGRPIGVEAEQAAIR